MSEQKPKSELEDAVEGIGKVATGVFGRLFGAKAVGRADLDAQPTVHPDVDKAITDVGDAFGKVLYAVGEGLTKHPVDPGQAVSEIGASLRDPDPVPKQEGWSGLTTGLSHLAEGVGAFAGRVADEVSGKKPAKPEDEPAPKPDDRPMYSAAEADEAPMPDDVSKG